MAESFWFRTGGRAAVALVFLGLSQCSGKAETQSLEATAGSNAVGGSSAVGGSDTGGTLAVLPQGGSAGSPAPSACGKARSVPVGRTPKACPATNLAGYGYPDAGTVSCNADADCADAGAATACLNGVCGPDMCFTDEDCPNGQACRCASDERGNALHSNSCVPAACRVDADCGPNGSCSASFSGYCGSLIGYDCHSPADECNSNADCCGDTPSCQYQTKLGRFTCQAASVCAG